MPEIESAPTARSINDYFEHGTLRLTLTGVLAKSSNIGTVLAAREMRTAQLYRYLRDVRSGPAHRHPGLRRVRRACSPQPSAWSDIVRDNIAFGQGLAVNAVQMAAAINTIANGGVYVQPSLVKGKATTRDGVETGSDVADQRRVVSEDGRRGRQPDDGDGDRPRRAAPRRAPRSQGYRVAGKTGTAQMVNEDCGCYDGTKFTVSFAGFAPADDPRFTVYVVVHKPTNGGGGGSTGGPAFRKIMSYLLQHYAVPPTGVPAPELPATWRPGAGRDADVAVARARPRTWPRAPLQPSGPFPPLVDSRRDRDPSRGTRPAPRSATSWPSARGGTPGGGHAGRGPGVTGLTLSSRAVPPGRPLRRARRVAARTAPASPPTRSAAGAVAVLTDPDGRPALPRGRRRRPRGRRTPPRVRSSAPSPPGCTATPRRPAGCSR